jgi:hypothetical protein
MENSTGEANGGNGTNNGGESAPIGLGVETAKRGRGRPPGSGNKNRPLNFGGEKENISRRAPDVDSLESAKFIGTALVTLVELGESFVHGSCSARIEKQRAEKLAEFLKLAEKFSLKETDKKLIADSMEKIALRYELLSKFGPEVVLSITLAQYGMRQLALMKFVNAVTKELNQSQPEKTQS